jgi:hypothetical protein
MGNMKAKHKDLVGKPEVKGHLRGRLSWCDNIKMN